VYVADHTHAQPCTMCMPSPCSASHFEPCLVAQPELGSQHHHSFDHKPVCSSSPPHYSVGTVFHFQLITVNPPVFPSFIEFLFWVQAQSLLASALISLVLLLLPDLLRIPNLYLCLSSAGLRCSCCAFESFPPSSDVARYNVQQCHHGQHNPLQLVIIRPKMVFSRRCCPHHHTPHTDICCVSCSKGQGLLVCYGVCACV